MGNTCFIPRRIEQQHKMGLELHQHSPLDEDLGHSFCYVRPTFDSCSDLSNSNSNSNSSIMIDSANTSEELLEPAPDPASKTHLLETSFKSISGASVSANTSTSRSILSSDHFTSFPNVPVDRAAAFESTPSFAALPLQKVPRGIAHSGPIIGSGSGLLGGLGSASGSGFLSGPLERGFLSGPLERGFMSGPLERERSTMSGPMEPQPDPALALTPTPTSRKNPRKSLEEYVRPVRRALSRTVSTITKRGAFRKTSSSSPSGMNEVSELCSESCSDDAHNLQWAQGKAGEDRVHVVLSEDHGWMFVGIYDGFNGPDAPDFLMSNLYTAVYRELQKLLCDQKFELPQSPRKSFTTLGPSPARNGLQGMEVDDFPQPAPPSAGSSGAPSSKQQVKLKSILGVKLSRKKKVSYKRLFRWRYDWENERSEAGEEVDGPPVRSKRGCSVDHSSVLRALERALEFTENAYLEMTERSVVENPELALVGSCLLVMLMKDEDVYIMNVGDSRAVLAQDTRSFEGTRGSSRGNHPASSQMSESKEADHQERIGARDSMLRMELERIIEETPTELAALDSSSYDLGDLAPPPLSLNLGALQLSSDHSTSIEKEVLRIRMEHPDDEASISNDRVKGRLKVTRAFGAGYLKQPKLNEAVLEMFRIEFVGEAPYITCSPYLQHHRLSSRDQFLVLSSDGLYQYLSNEEVVAHVEWFMEKFPEGDPAQYLIEELLFRAAKKAGMDFHELLDIPQGDRRKYHDDVTVMVISLEGRIWRSSG